jgi:hypothetical protein
MPIDPRLATRLRQLLVGGCCLWAVLYLRSADRYGLLDHVDLPIHEAGHLVFAPFGEFLGFLGGTLLQLLFPLAFVVHLWRRADHFAAWMVTGWVAQNLWNIARYIGDARAQVLPLVGGGEHDWAYLLGETGLLMSDTAIAAAVQAAGVVLFCFAMVKAYFHSTPDPEQVAACGAES